jgi:hypothetical protein
LRSGRASRWLKNHDGGMAERFKAPVLKIRIGVCITV